MVIIRYIGDKANMDTQHKFAMKLDEALITLYSNIDYRFNIAECDPAGAGKDDILVILTQNEYAKAYYKGFYKDNDFVDASHLDSDKAFEDIFVILDKRPDAIRWKDTNTKNYRIVIDFDDLYLLQDILPALTNKFGDCWTVRSERSQLLVIDIKGHDFEELKEALWTIKKVQDKIKKV